MRKLYEKLIILIKFSYTPSIACWWCICISTCLDQREMKQLTGCQRTCSLICFWVHGFFYSGGKLKKFLADIQIEVDVVMMICDYLINFIILLLKFSFTDSVQRLLLCYKSIDKSSVTIYLTFFLLWAAAGSFYCFFNADWQEFLDFYESYIYEN